MKIQEKSFATEVVMVFLIVLLTFVTIIGNGSYLAIFARFKVFRRNFTNILIVSLAVVDCLNALSNVPLFTIFFVVDPNWLKGKAWAIISSSLHLECFLLNLMSMTALMVDRFLSVHLGLKYFTWKTTKKAKIAVFLMWLVCTIAVVLLAVPLFNMDLDGVSLSTSRGMIFEKRLLIVAPIIVLFTIASTVLGILTCYSIYQKKKERMLLNLPPLCAEARLKMDIKATKTVAMTVALYYICYISAIVFSIWRRNEEERVFNAWFAFMVTFCTFLSSALNSIIYVARYRRTRTAFKQLLNDPCGTSAYQENPVRKENEARQREKKPQIEGEEMKECKDPGTSVRPGTNPESDTRRPTSAKRQYSDTKKAWGKNEDDGGSLDGQVTMVTVARQARRDSEKVQDENVKSSGSVRGKRKKMNAARRNGIIGTSPKENEARQREKKPQIVEEEMKECKDPGTSVRPGPNPGSDTRRSTSAKRQHSDTKIAWGKNEDNGGSLDGQVTMVTVARQARRDGEKVQDEDVKSSGSVRGRRKKMNAARRNGIVGTSPRVKVRPCTSSSP